MTAESCVMGEYSLSEIEDAIASRRYLDHLPPAMEADFQLRTARFQERLTRSSLWPTILPYNAFLLIDLLLLQATFWLAVLLHVVVTAIIAGFCTRYVWLPARYNSRWLMATLPIAMVTQIMTVFALNASPDAFHYQYLAIMIVVYSNITQRLGVDFARVVSTSCAGIYALFLIGAGAPSQVLIVGLAMMFAAGYLTLIANKRMQRDERFAFLQRLREELLRKAAEEQSLHDPLTKSWKSAQSRPGGVRPVEVLQSRVAGSIGGGDPRRHRQLQVVQRQTRPRARGRMPEAYRKPAFRVRARDPGHRNPIWRRGVPRTRRPDNGKRRARYRRATKSPDRVGRSPAPGEPARGSRYREPRRCGG